MLVTLAWRKLGMHLIAGWPILTALAITSGSVPLLLDSRYRSIVGWVMIPVLLEGAMLTLIYINVS